MKTGGRQGAAFPIDHDIDSAAADWLLRRDAGLDGAARREFEEWIAADLRHEEAFGRLASAWDVFDRAERKGAGKSIVDLLEARARERRAWRIRAAVAACALFAAAVLFGVFQRFAARHGALARTENPVAFEAIRKLPDGSIVELNTGAGISVQYEPAVRRVRLNRGEAHFRIEKDPARPFLVQVGGLVVRAVGTAFTVKLQSAAVEVVVTEGRVAVDKTVGFPGSAASQAAAPTDAGGLPAFGPQTLAVVEAGNRILVGTGSGDYVPQVSPMTRSQIEQRLAWRMHRLEFGGMELSQVVAAMNRSNRLQIVLGDTLLGSLHVSGVFDSENQEGFIRIVEATFDLRADRRGKDEVILTRRLEPSASR